MAHGQFGFETPQEVQARIAQTFRDRSDRASTQGSGAQAGAALGQIFGGSIRKRIETSQERAELRKKFEAEGIDEKEARARAKRELPVKYAQVRKAEDIQEITSGLPEIIEGLTGTRGMKQALGLLEISERLSDAGLHQEAFRVREQGLAAFQVEQALVLSREDIKAGTDLKTQQADLANQKRLELLSEETPKDETVRLQARRRELTQQLAVGPDPAATREIGEINSRIRKLFTVTGQSAEDLLTTGFTVSTLTDLQKKFVASDMALDRMLQAGQSFQPRFLRIGSKLANFFRTQVDKFAELPEADARELAAYTTFKRDSAENMNLYIKQITGAQMAIQEAERLLKGIPNAELDSPQEYQSKYIATVRGIMAVRERTRRALEAGKPLLLTDVDKGRPGAFESFLPPLEEVLKFIGISDEADEQLAKDVDKTLDTVADFIEELGRQTQQPTPPPQR